MKTLLLPPPFYFKIRKFLLVSSFLVFVVDIGFTQMYISGSQNVCPQIDTGENNYTYTVHNVPPNSQLTSNLNWPWDGTISTNNINNTISVAYGNSVTAFTTNILARALDKPQGLYEFDRYLLNPITVQVNAPSSPNGGNILVCPNGPNVNLSTETSLGCGFHCDYIWTAPPGVNLQANGSTFGNQIRVSPSNLPSIISSGLPNGNLGQLQVAAKWSECGLNGDNYGYATLYSGAPVLNPKVNNVPTSGFACVNDNGFLQVDYWPNSNYNTWTIIGGNGTIQPNGSSCYVDPNDFLLVRVEQANSCGTTSFSFYISECGSSAYSISPNPATASLTVAFEHKEFAEGLLESIELLDFDGKSYSKTNFKEEKNKTYFEQKKSFTINTKSLKRGNYVLHLNFSEFTDKKQIVLK